MESIFTQLSLVIAVVLIVSFIARILKQPLIIGYIASGILVGPLLLNFLPEGNTIVTFSEIGISFLLFIVGLSLSPKVIKEVGKVAAITGIGQVVFTSIVGFIILYALGFSKVTSLYISVAITFSSTIIIMKLLSDKDALDKLYGKISIGFLLIQDFIAILLLITISSLSSGANATAGITTVILKGAAIILILAPVSYYVLPRLSGFFAKSQEFLFVFALSWGLGLASAFLYAGFSIEVGALIAGIILSVSPYSYEISSKLKPLRDFFIISFFVLLGSQIVFLELSRYLLPIIILSLFILIGNPFIAMVLIGYFGYSKSTSFMAGLTVAQISEFSLILISLGVRLGHIPQEALSMVAVIGLITIAGSTYLIMYSEKIYSKLSKYLSLFERKSVKKEEFKTKEYDYILFGENRIGYPIMKNFMKMKNYLIVDFNPNRVKRLKEKRVNCIYGDASNSEFLDELRIEKAKMIVSTIPERETNLLILNKIRAKSDKAIVIVTTRQQISDAIELYSAGADYVIHPYFVGGEYTSSLIERAGQNKEEYKKEKKSQIKQLIERLK